MSEEEVKAFLGIFPQFPIILEFSRQAAEEIRRRDYEVRIGKMEKEKATKLKCFICEQRKNKKTHKRMQKLVINPIAEDEDTSESP